MTDKDIGHGGDHLTEKELAGFVRLLLAGEKLPEPSEEVVAYIERLAGEQAVDEATVARAARAAWTTIMKERLRAAHPKPVRPLGSHLMAKRTEASCRIEDVAAVLGERVETLRGLESQTVDPLVLGAPRLAVIAETFGLVLSELRDAVRLALSGDAPRATGASFARSHEEGFKLEAMRLAADDLLRAARARPVPISRETEERLATMLAEVRTILEQRGAKELLD